MCCIRNTSKTFFSIFYKPRNVRHTRMQRSASACSSASAAMRSSGSVPEKRQMTQLPSVKYTLQPSSRLM